MPVHNETLPQDRPVIRANYSPYNWTDDRLVELIGGFITEHGYSPSVRDLCDDVYAGAGRRPSLSTMHHVLRRARDSGLITWTTKEARTIRLARPAQEALNG